MLHNIYVLDVTYNFKRDTVIMLFDSAMSVTDANDDFSGTNVFPLFVIRTSTCLSFHKYNNHRHCPCSISN